MSMPSDTHLLLADGHVHLYDCFDLTQLLDAAVVNFAAVAEQYEKASGFSGVLLLTETARDNVFERLLAAADSPETPDDSSFGWRFSRTAEGMSLLARKRATQLVLIAGRQIVTRERLEVLALGTDRRFADGEPLRDTLQQVRAADAIPVLPWGVGKWLGRRGRLVARELAGGDGFRPLLGDNAGRPIIWPRSRLFRRAEQHGVKILPGTDPLPLSTEATRVGSFGFGLFAPLSPDRPAAELKRLLVDADRPIFSYGKLENVARFLRNQLLIRLR